MSQKILIVDDGHRLSAGLAIALLGYDTVITTSQIPRVPQNGLMIEVKEPEPPPVFDWMGEDSYRMVRPRRNRNKNSNQAKSRRRNRR